MKTNVQSKVLGGGTCDICGLPALLMAYDAPTGLKAGKCCAKELAIADLALTEYGPKAGICHPSK